MSFKWLALQQAGLCFTVVLSCMPSNELSAQESELRCSMNEANRVIVCDVYSDNVQITGVEYNRGNCPSLDAIILNICQEERVSGMALQRFHGIPYEGDINVCAQRYKYGNPGGWATTRRFGDRVVLPYGACNLLEYKIQTRRATWRYTR